MYSEVNKHFRCDFRNIPKYNMSELHFNSTTILLTLAFC